MFLILLLSLVSYACTLEVAVYRTSAVDQIAYVGLNSGICSKIGASVHLESSKGVTCECPSNKTFYSKSISDSPSCRSDDGADLGCPICTGDCLHILDSSLTLSRVSTGNHYACSKTYGGYTIKRWNGKSWVQFSRTDDFTVSYTTSEGKTYVDFEWNDENSYLLYTGLFLITPYCGNKPLSCFLAKAIGLEAYTTIDANNNESKKSKTAVSASVSTVIIFLLFLFVYLYYKRGYLKTKIQALRRNQQNKIEKKVEVPIAPVVNPAFVLSASESQVIKPPAHTSYNNGGSHATLSPGPATSPPILTNVSVTQHPQPNHSQPPVHHPVTQTLQQSITPTSNTQVQSKTNLGTQNKLLSSVVS
ncbi:uncharacterized protein LOC130635465 [Hydractinia symbiolongicarpus]|uniref:uncharacterized protein LOC130635465 n=1 Tax=Hydractinia symbiolongicarpus TaxID=13093 RepID=UPI002550A039|nr:uncharacterized protein LOC130635465 [Hydractinia symbiolongicarpus]